MAREVKDTGCSRSCMGSSAAMFVAGLLGLLLCTVLWEITRIGRCTFSRRRCWHVLTETTKPSVRFILFFSLRRLGLATSLLTAVVPVRGAYGMLLSYRTSLHFHKATGLRGAKFY